MRVLHVIPSVGPVRGGPSEAVLAMTAALETKGIVADIVTTNDNGSQTLQVPTGMFVNHSGSRVCFFPRWSPPLAALREFQFSSGFPAWLRDHLPDYDGLHVHAVFSYLCTRSMQIARRMQKPFILRPLGQLDTWSLQQKSLKKKLYFALAEKRNLLSAAAVHCTSETEAENVRNLLPSARVAVIPHGISTPEAPPGAAALLRSELGIPPTNRVILFLSRWHPKKNIPLLLKVLGSLKHERWTLVLAGSADDGYQAIVKSAIRAETLQDRVICPGHVQGSLKNLLLYGADLFVLPSITENFGVAVAEALCCGLPCIVSEGVDLSPVVTELSAGLVCKPKEDELRDAIQAGLSMDFDRQGFSMNARLRFSWNGTASALDKLYSELFKAVLS